MEKHKCKLCLRSFANGRALGGHMRSHMLNLPVPPKQSEFVPIQLSFEADSSPSQSSSSFYGLRENPKKSFRFADPEFAFAAADTGSVILQDRESETESSRNPTRTRSKRAWQLGGDGGGGGGGSGESEKKIMKVCKISKTNESASSVSDTTREEDVAFCLMMLSRDKWKEENINNLLYDHDQDDDEDEEDDEEDENNEDDDGYESEEKSLKKSNNKVRGRYKCETCEKVFRSYQALGGHRASHKKIKLNNNNNNNNNNEGELEVQHVVVEKKIHECPVCFRVFASGQALGGHKRTHVIGSSTAATTVSVRSSVATVSVRTASTTRVGDSLIDLNLPAPVDDDEEEEEDVSQFDDSAVSDAEFVKL
ncbi:hypothetical protein GLYMA_01G134200v4 [Glycine max]|uniref:C2H2-type domain-containing protein n=2 Tax=Glycine subgen. Soja TaxID=1462606 RepID=K7K3N0_SOYBN|nr:zinc finger protein ZAT9 [Glycine max]XP_028237853.1 zinc finger protein ZAT9-like [Glycine soja]KAG5069324.1 hypothetical protein JHK85_001701 [Glycine max]KAG5089048.1 hypothetical protein JHK86_001660 [Glycine max]KAH1162944.1 hypothetical protein GYH30_001459 [Glycine max]KAH1266406.1 Zinc finger protein ZAT9 [Glycine max]KRH76140.1 hypothetical protein GLYMA_01G134200v4 [Glycine max]|eukprot:XP_003517016.1 zinc finger protein ZAT9 [Glycine max]